MFRVDNMSAEIKYGTQPAAVEIQMKLGSVASFLTMIEQSRVENTPLGEMIRQWDLKKGHVYQSLQGRVAPSKGMQVITAYVLNMPVEELFTPEALVGVRTRPGPRQVTRTDRSEATKVAERRRLENEQLVSAIRAIAHGDVHGDAHGDVHGPGGLEGLALALMDGIGDDRGVARATYDGLHEIADAVHDGLRTIADAIHETGRGQAPS
jgi:hypothetical protein